jgi:ATP-dependent RNA/DNA helicase IGHMBP2
MLDIQKYFQKLQLAIDEEEKEETRRYSFENGQSLKDLKKSGHALHPIKINQKSFGFADYPEVSFHYPFPFENNFFKGSCPIEVFCPGEESIKGILLFLEGKKGELRLFAPDFPDWLEDGDTGIKLAPDIRTLTIMRKALDKELKDSAIAIQPVDTVESLEIIKWNNPNLNEGQKLAISELLKNPELEIVHGPPGTGKTTTLVEAISQWVQKGKKVLVSAPSNTAVDHVASILPKEFNVLRIGNSVKVREDVFPLTPEGKWKNSSDLKNLKRLKIQAEQLRKMAHSYKRNFGKSEREQRSLLFKEVNNIRKQIKDIKKSTEETWFDKAQIVLGTPVAIVDQTFDYNHFDVLVIDEAAQCLEPLAWAIFPFGQKIVLAGDPYQLPPTILSQKASELGLNVSILERCLKAKYPVYFLPIQYRMPKNIADFSSNYFYEGRLESFKPSLDSALLFYDTAGAGYDEEKGDQGGSLKNEGEVDAILKIIGLENLNLAKTTVLSPYSGQVALLRDRLEGKIRISTIDSYQGQEQEIVVISLVRSNANQEIGFLKDYRRMNVAMTRAKTRLIIVGDSATLGTDPFYAAFLEYAESQGAYRSVWELV